MLLGGKKWKNVFGWDKETLKQVAADMKNSDTKWGMVWWVKVS
jgi:hypothetical protein